ncbi:MAG: phosphoribosyltransferase family protein [Mycoplasmatales bacterium]
MNKLQLEIINKTKVLENNIVLVDNIINHQVDVKLLNKIAREIYNQHKNLGINKIVTVETGGIALAVILSSYFNDCTVLYGKKGISKIQNIDDIYQANVISYTKKNSYILGINKNYLNSDDNVLIIDDFLASGEVINGLLNICEQANASVLAISVIINKIFQNNTINTNIDIHSILPIIDIIDSNIILQKNDSSL